MCTATSAPPALSFECDTFLQPSHTGSGPVRIVSSPLNAGLAHDIVLVALQTNDIPARRPEISALRKHQIMIMILIAFFAIMLDSSITLCTTCHASAWHPEAHSPTFSPRARSKLDAGLSAGGGETCSTRKGIAGAMRRSASSNEQIKGKAS